MASRSAVLLKPTFMLKTPAKRRRAPVRAIAQQINILCSAKLAVVGL
jgi:hypothetical protein